VSSSLKGEFDDLATTPKEISAYDLLPNTKVEIMETVDAKHNVLAQGNHNPCQWVN
jgi:hypothetical protein